MDLLAALRLSATGPSGAIGWAPTLIRGLDPATEVATEVRAGAGADLYTVAPD